MILWDFQENAKPAEIKVLRFLLSEDTAGKRRGVTRQSVEN